jgi:ABC-type uncharacterized transport system substrate-binding protein
VANDPLFFNRATQFVVLAARHAIPTLYFRREFAAAGGLMSYGSDFTEQYRALGVYAARILKGDKCLCNVNHQLKFRPQLNRQITRSAHRDVQGG